MKKKKEQPKKTEAKCSTSDTIIGTVVATLLVIGLGIGLYTGYQEYIEPVYGECYLNMETNVFAKVTSVYNDESVSYVYADLDESDINRNFRETSDFLSKYSKDRNCNLYQAAYSLVQIKTDLSYLERDVNSIRKSINDIPRSKK